ncbi:MAG: 5-bromo-4-chloroindolyl phosphate hydrolysis family protein [Clostridia bacterium]|nr:5-bromo-4-chloroindolyl phosphate hydrolysis family protein [Clostridia bacterium]MDY5554118.1 5-bromo-4-chloroindolyl phosphate hydrolysis family protein [Blautia sp.]
MNNRDFDDLGELGRMVKDIVDEAVNTSNFQEMTQEIKNKTKTFEERRKQERQQQAREQEHKEQLPVLYGKTSTIRVKGTVMTAAGGILAGGMGLGLLVLAIFGAIGNVNSLVIGGACFMGVGAAAGAGLLITGLRKLGQLGRFQKYIKTLGRHTYCNFDQLAQATGKSLKFVKKDIKSMISGGWFLQGHTDDQETCLITSDETYRQYMQTSKALEQRRKEEEKAKEQQEKSWRTVSPQVQDILDKGNEFLDRIRKSNDAIPGEEISAKISRMELIVQKIFERARNHPEVIPDLKKMMDYYLPMTVKLLSAYEDMDRQPVQGDNIQSSKKEIEDTLDTLNQAFEKLLDSMFQDTAWDISSDISVLHTMLAQEGLTEDDFARMKEK